MSSIPKSLLRWRNTILESSRINQTTETIKTNWFAYVLVLPLFLYLLALVWWQFVYGIYMSFFRYSFTFSQPQFVGLENYTMLFEWGPFYTSLIATIIYGSATTAIHILIALIIALGINHVRQGKDIFRSVAILPYTMPPVAVGALWFYLLDPRYGPVFGYLTKLNILSSAPQWGVDSTAAMSVIVFVAGWTFWPFAFLIIDASLSKVPDAEYESAKIYGANAISRFRHVTFPHIKSALIVATSIRVIWNLAKVDQPLLLTQGGPGNATSILGILLYEITLTQGRFGQAYAVGMFLFLITVGFTVLLIREFRKQDTGVTEV